MAGYDPTIDFTSSNTEPYDSIARGFDPAAEWDRRMAEARRANRNAILGMTLFGGMFVVSALILTIVIWMR